MIAGGREATTHSRAMSDEARPKDRQRQGAARLWAHRVAIGRVESGRSGVEPLLSPLKGKRGQRTATRCSAVCDGGFKQPHSQRSGQHLVDLGDVGHGLEHVVV